MSGFVNYKKGCTWLAAASNKVYQLLAHGRWFSLGTPASSTTKTGRHDSAKSGVKHNKSINIFRHNLFKDESFHLFCRFPHLAKYLEIKYVKLDPIRWKMRGVSSFFISAHFHICLFYVNYKKGCTRLAAASDKVYQLLAHGRWFSPGTSASSTTKTGRNDIAEILLKVELNTKNQIIKSICLFYSTLILNAIQKFVTLKCIFLTYFSL